MIDLSAVMEYMVCEYVPKVSISIVMNFGAASSVKINVILLSYDIRLIGLYNTSSYGDCHTYVLSFLFRY